MNKKKNWNTRYLTAELEQKYERKANVRRERKANIKHEVNLKRSLLDITAISSVLPVETSLANSHRQMVAFKQLPPSSRLR